MAVTKGILHRVDYKWIALSNTTLGVMMAAMNSSIVLISLPAIFRGLNVNPLEPAESGYLLWMLLGYMVITATLLVTLGRLSDMWGRVGSIIWASSSSPSARFCSSSPPRPATPGAIEMILFRLVQGVGGGFLIANSAAILTDAFPPNERGTGAGPEHGRRTGRQPARPDRRRLPVHPLVAGRLPGQRADRHLRHDLGLQDAARAGDHARGKGHRPAGQPLPGRRPDHLPGRHDLRHHALRHGHHRLGQPAGARRAGARACCCSGVRDSREPRWPIRCSI